MIDLQYLEQVLFDLIRIPSVNPSLVADGAGEAQAAEYVAGRLFELGMTVQILEHQVAYSPVRRCSVLAKLPGSGKGKSLMFNAHLDTVGVYGMEAPFEPVRREGYVYGRGAQDMKGSLAAMIATLKSLRESESRLSGDIYLAAVADEEYGSQGTFGLIEKMRQEGLTCHGAIVTEPTGMQVAIAHRGYVWLEVETNGRAAHGSRWWEGIDANRMMGRVLNRLDHLAGELIQRPAHPQVGPPSLHTPLIQGGSEMSIYADQCKLQIERRTIPGETPEFVTAEIQNLLNVLAAEDERFSSQLHAWLDRPPFEAHPDSALLPVLLKHTGDVMQKPAEPGGIPFWTDAALLAGEGMDVLLIGPTGAGLHSPEEKVDLASCIQLAEILTRTAQEYCV